jgi:hypothetical protein
VDLYFFRKTWQPSPINNNESSITGVAPNIRGFITIFTEWSSTSFKYAISKDRLTDENATILDLDTTQLNHIVFKYVGLKLTVWVNGLSRKTHNNNVLNGILGISKGVKELGILSVYNRELNKAEIIEHFIENHVKNFTDDEVLI